MAHPHPRSCWRSEVVSRLGAQWQLKFFGVPVFIGVFFAAYFLLLRFPVFEVTLMPVTALDEAIPFQPTSLIAYFSLWLYVSLAPALLKTREELLFHGKVAATVGMVGFAIFFFWPTAIPHAAGLRETDVSTLSWLKQIDAAGNACPSLHVAFAVLSGFWLHRTLSQIRAPKALRWLNIAWCGVIAYSTLSTKQHVVVDVIGGAFLGSIGGIIGSTNARQKRVQVSRPKESVLLSD